MPNDKALRFLFAVLLLLAGCSAVVIIMSALTRSAHW